MKFVLIDQDITSMQAVHQKFAKKLELPDWYGHNLDALHDCLTDLQEDTYIQIRGYDALLEQMGKPFAHLRNMLLCTAEESAFVHIDIR